MPPKKTLRSPFGLFMAKMRRTDPRIRSMPMSTIVGHCKPLYDSLSADVRKRLDQLSQKVRTESLNDFEVNKLLDGLSLDNTDTSDDESGSVAQTTLATTSATNLPQFKFEYNSDKKRFKDDSYDDDSDEEEFLILDTINKAMEPIEQFPKVTIVCICFNVLVHTYEDDFIPNEVGLTAFTVEDGLQKTFTKLIPNDIPSGYYATAKKFSDNYHKIPITSKGNPLFDNNSGQLFEEIYDFMATSGLKDNRNRRIVFCKAEQNGCSDLRQVNGCLKWLQKNGPKQTTKSLTDDFHVFDITNLLFLTTKKLCLSARPMALCVEALIRTVFDFHLDMRCEFHAEDENNYCALAATKRTAYLFLDQIFAVQLKPDFDVKPKPTHRPVKPVDNSVTYTMKVTDTQPVYRREYRFQMAKQAPAPQPPAELVRPQLKTGIGRGQLLKNLRNSKN